MGISAKEVNELRKKTGSGMMDCKKALQESNGDMQAAIDFLRKKGQKIAAKRGDRDAKEGLVIAKTTNDSSKGVLICLNCEKTPSNVDQLLNLSFDGNGLSIGDKITEQTGVIGEKIEISGYEIIEAVQVIAYNHPGNQIASIVGMNDKAHDEGNHDLSEQLLKKGLKLINDL